MVCVYVFINDSNLTGFFSNFVIKTSEFFNSTFSGSAVIQFFF